MKYLLNLLILLFSISIFSSSFAGNYDDWPDDAICLWLEQRPDHKLVELEEKISYLQNMLDELNMVVFRQGEKIEKLNNQIKETNEKLINQSETQSDQSEVVGDKPPHY